MLGVWECAELESTIYHTLRMGKRTLERSEAQVVCIYSNFIIWDET